MKMALFIDRPAKHTVLSIKTALSVDRWLEFAPLSTRTNIFMDRSIDRCLWEKFLQY